MPIYSIVYCHYLLNQQTKNGLVLTILREIYDDYTELQRMLMIRDQRIYLNKKMESLDREMCSAIHNVKL